MEKAPSHRQAISPPASNGFWRVVTIVHDVIIFGALGAVMLELLVLPNVERAVLLYFLPPVFAWLFVVADRGKFEPVIVAGCRTFLSMIAIAVVIGEQGWWLAGLKPLFPGLPPEANRILFCYFCGFGLFLWIICPAYVLFPAMPDASGLTQRRATVTLGAVRAIWLASIASLICALFLGRGKFF